MIANRATRKAKQLRQKLSLRGRVDVESVANILGLTIVPLKLESLQELMVDDCIGVAARLEPAWRRWVIAHAIGHKVLHPGNHMWMRKHTSLGNRLEREAEDFARSLLMDPGEAVDAGLLDAWDLADYFGVPTEMACLQVPFQEVYDARYGTASWLFRL